MAVVLPNISLRIRKRAHPAARDEWGVPVLGEPSPWSEPLPAGIKERTAPGPDEQEPWGVRLDPSLWPVEAGDELTDGDRVWVIVGSPKLHTVPGVPDVDHVACEAVLNPPEVP